MTGWTKQDYEDNYKNRVERHLRPPCPTNIRKEVSVAYCRKFIESYIHGRLDTLIELLSIHFRDRVVIVGCGFGWGTEYIKGQTGCTAIGTDISDWIHSVKDTDESEDIRAEIAKVGLDPNGERAAQILAFCLIPGPRARTPILNEDLMTRESRERLRAELGGQDPTWIITEDMIQPLTDAEIRGWANSMRAFSSEICHLHNGKPRTNEQLHALTGHKCFHYGPNELIG